MVRGTVAGLGALVAALAVVWGTVWASPSEPAGRVLSVERSADRVSATSTWTPTPGAENQIFMYVGKLLLGEEDATGSGLDLGSYSETTLSGSADSLVISGLDPWREYIYAVGKAEMGEDGRWVWSEWIIAGNILPPEGSAEADRAALAALYDATDGANWRENDGWLSDAPVGEWRGIKTDTDGRVVEISLWLNGLDGGLPPEIGDLAKLERLVLPMNSLDGGLPPELGELASLRELVLMGNGLSGRIPAQLGGLLKLEKLYLSVGNEFSGCVPGALRNVAVNDLSELGLEYCG